MPAWGRRRSLPCRRKRKAASALTGVRAAGPIRSRSVSQSHKGPLSYSTWGPSWAMYGGPLGRARPPRLWWASYRCTPAPASALAMAATRPASPPPTIVSCLIPQTPGRFQPSPRRAEEPQKGSEPLQGVELEELVRAAQRGDPLAMAALVRAVAPYVGRICGSIALHDGDDAMQETMIQLLRNLRRFASRPRCGAGCGASRCGRRSGWPRSEEHTSE